MEHHGRKGASQFFTSPSGGGATGAIYSRERISEQMGSRKQKQPLARRDSVSTAREFPTGLQGDPQARTQSVAVVQPAAVQVVSKTSTAATEPIQAEAGRLDSGSEAKVVPKPKQYTPPVCSVCPAVPGVNYTEVYGKIETANSIVRYCRCRKCRNTFKDITPRFNGD